MNSKPEKILVIKLGALGDFIQATGAMHAIRNHHPGAEITLLTTAPFVTLGDMTAYFDHVMIDEKPRWHQFAKWRALKEKLNAENYTRVYDLQNNDRTALYFKLFSPKPEWVGAAKGASHQNNSPARTAGHAFDGHVETLALAGIKNVEIDPLEWLDASIVSFPLRRPYVLLVPGSAPGRHEKRWPAAHYARLGLMLSQWGYQPVILGAAAESAILDEIASASPDILNLCGQTSLAQLAALAREAAACIGNDTGPVHLIAATGCPVLALFSKHSNLVKHAPKGGAVKILQSDDPAQLNPEQVLSHFQPREEPPQNSASLH